MGKDIANPAEMNFDGSEAHKKAYSVAGAYRGKTTPVKSFSRNGLGLYDMSGNVWEWCEDWYGDYPGSSNAGCSGPASGTYRVLRGGSWFDDAESSRASSRVDIRPEFSYYNYGLRLACGVSPG